MKCLLFQLFNQSVNSSSQEITWNKFEQSLLIKEDIDHIDIVNKENKLAKASDQYESILMAEAQAAKKSREIPNNTELKSDLMDEMSTLSYDLEMLKRELMRIR